jgi:hypothetical protein
MIQRSFLWQGIKEGRKMSLVSWQKVCNPKKAGGLGLRDPTILNKVLSAKIWWRWLKDPKIFGHDCGGKNTPPQPRKKSSSGGMVKAQGRSSGMLARNNRGLIMDHSFWELQNGSSTNFWSDSWQQLPALNTDPTLRTSFPLQLSQDLQSHRLLEAF